MPISTRLIRRRIKSISNTRKITKAMELVAASKMRRATSRALASRRYARSGAEMILSLAESAEKRLHPLFEERPVRRSLALLVTSHRGLAGGFNANIVKRLWEFRLTDSPAETAWRFVTVGRKGEEALRRGGEEIAASFETLGETPTLTDAAPIAEYLRQEFIAGRADRVILAYTDFISTISQKPVIQRILPIVPALDFTAAAGARLKAETIYEPEAKFIFDAFLPRMIDVLVYQALLESSASEHSARMLAMRNASDAAEEMTDDLNFTFNQARQSAITREISEIAAGKAREQ